MSSEPRERLAKVMRDLQNAIVHACECPKRVCELSEDLTNSADWAKDSPDPWTPELVEQAGKLLEEAAAAAKGTEYESRCAARPKDFARGLVNARTKPQPESYIRLAQMREQKL
jgi:hypothetical protein